MLDKATIFSKAMNNSEEDFYVNSKGQTVFTSAFLAKRGYCCGNGCLHCPYDYEGVRNAELRNELLNRRAAIYSSENQKSYNSDQKRRF